MVQMGTFASNTFTRRGFCSNPTFKTGGVPPRRQYAAPSTQEIISSEFFDDRSFSSPASLFSFGSSTVLASSLQPLSAPKKSLVSLPSSLASSSTTATLSGSTATAVAKQKQQQQQQQQQDAHQNYESRSDPASGALAMRSNLYSSASASVLISPSTCSTSSTVTAATTVLQQQQQQQQTPIRKRGFGRLPRCSEVPSSTLPRESTIVAAPAVAWVKSDLQEDQVHYQQQNQVQT